MTWPTKRRRVSSIREGVERSCKVHISSSHHHISRLHGEEQSIFGGKHRRRLKLDEVVRVHREMLEKARQDSHSFLFIWCYLCAFNIVYLFFVKKKNIVYLFYFIIFYSQNSKSIFYLNDPSSFLRTNIMLIFFISIYRNKFSNFQFKPD